VIVSCEQCRTQFRLDEAKIPEAGARVRCSKCNHAFFILPPGHADAVEAERLARDAVESALGPGAEEGESDWQFNHDADPPVETSSPLSPAGLAAAREAVDDLLGALTRSAPQRVSQAPPAAPQEEDPLAELGDAAGELFERPEPEARRETAREAFGSPESWNFFEGAEGAEDASDADDAAGAEVGRMVLTPRWKLLEEEREAAERGMDARAAAAELDASESGLLRRALGRVATGAGWLATLALLALGVWGSAVGSAPVGGGTVEGVDAAGYRASDLRGRWLENAVSGPLFVVSGRLRLEGGAAPASAGGLAAQLLDARGQALPGISAPIGPPFPERALRERDPAELQASQARAAAAFARLHAGETPAFQAVFHDVPPEAARFTLAPAR
jgi:predicted Zn finger-like uncharacterized protein